MVDPQERHVGTRRVPSPRPVRVDVARRTARGITQAIPHRRAPQELEALALQLFMLARKGGRRECGTRVLLARLTELLPESEGFLDSWHDHSPEEVAELLLSVTESLLCLRDARQPKDLA